MDWRVALRSFRKSPAWTALAVLVAAVGIGANTAIFSVVNGVLLQPLAYPEPDRIMTVGTRWNQAAGVGTVSGPDFADWKSGNTVFEDLAYYTGGESALVAGDQAIYANVRSVSPGFFRILRVTPAQGRLFADDEVQAAVVTQEFAARHLGGRAVGATLRAEGSAVTVAGVLPAGFRFQGKADVIVPSARSVEKESRSAHNYRVIGRLKDGVPLEQARAQMAAIGERLAREYPKENSRKSVAVLPLKDQMTGGVRTMLYVLLGAVGLVLLIACANVANLLLAKAAARTHEMAVRGALGASRARIVRQLLVESLLLGVGSAVLGVLLAIWGVDALVSLAPPNLPRLDEIRVSGWVLGFALLLSLASSVAFGLAPAWAAARVDLNEALKQGGRSASSGTGGRLRRALVVVEVALAVVLVAGAGLLIRSFARLSAVELGINPGGLLVMETDVPAKGLEDSERATGFYQALLPKLAALPGVAAVAATRSLPTQFHSNGGYQLEGSAPDDMYRQQAIFSVVTPGYFRVMGIRQSAGRDFDERDAFDAAGVAIINEELARVAFPGQNPLGRRLKCGLDRQSNEYMTIVGVVSNVRQLELSQASRPEIYMPYRQHPSFATAMSVVARASGDPAALVEPVRRLARAESAETPVRFTTMEDAIASSVVAPRFRTLLLAVFAGIALALALAGVYGVMSYAVSQRAGEVGIRMAMGAGSGDILRLMLADGLRLALLGLGLGLAGAFALSRFLAAFLYGVKATDPATYAAIAVFVLGATMTACLLPALRAARIDPLRVMRHE